MGYLGSGGFGYVDKVVSIRKGKDLLTIYARKQLHFSANASVTRDEAIREEVAVIQRLSHRHIVKLVATYSRRDDFGMIMDLADSDLEKFLKDCDPATSSTRFLLVKWFGCLASGLAYLHQNRVRHKDIKPKNILVKGATILWTDFGLARDAADETGLSTSGPVRAMTLMYCAPEVAEEEHRGTAADLFSLGCVFLEMLTVLLGLSDMSLDAFRISRAKQSGHYHANLGSVLSWIFRVSSKILEIFRLDVQKTLIESSWDGSDAEPVRWPGSMIFFILQWCFAMLQPEAVQRVSATQLKSLINTTYAQYCNDGPPGWKVTVPSDRNPLIRCCTNALESSGVMESVWTLKRWPTQEREKYLKARSSFDWTNVNYWYSYGREPFDPRPRFKHYQLLDMATRRSQELRKALTILRMIRIDFYSALIPMTWLRSLIPKLVWDDVAYADFSNILSDFYSSIGIE